MFPALIPAKKYRLETMSKLKSTVDKRALIRRLHPGVKYLACENNIANHANISEQTQCEGWH